MLTREDFKLYFEQIRAEWVEKYGYRDIVRPVIQQFDGKVLNARLANAVKPLLPKYVWTKLAANYDGSQTLLVGRYGCEYSVRIVVNEEGRIKADATLTRDAELWPGTEVLEDPAKEAERVHALYERVEAVCHEWSQGAGYGSHLYSVRTSESWSTVQDLRRKAERKVS